MQLQSQEQEKQFQQDQNCVNNLTKSKTRIYQYQVKPELYIKMKQDFSKFQMSIVDQPQFSEDGSIIVCPICYDPSFADSNIQDKYVVSMSCSHQFHYVCLQPLLNNNFLKCPVCNQIVGQLKGDQPDGIMEVKTIKQRCEGYKCNTIQIKYIFHNGLRNGKYFSGTTRFAYLPENEEGKYVLSLLRKAFDQKLVFTIGTSLTTGQDNCIVWNGIHHKTSLDGGPQNYGYPDPTYFDRVLDELKQKGITQSKN
ncbi:unnamed protein product [Paramecium pentaurelia]|uniref:RING-type domain-containing protein n=1 Tax=Paramecium pentaurelia TaxID=43138 RepID=A0A8S1WEN5_9CILI|nr:unnamed protein product [Paramecium pentaurelia]